MSVSRGSAMPRPAPPGTNPMWEREVPGVGLVYFNGPVFREGRRSYLLRMAEDGRNRSVICLVLSDGSVWKWYFGWGARKEEFAAVLEEAREFILAHHVLTS